ncbi:MAG: ribose 5-phosphate isomerase B [Alphaproteobacteria bacterium]|jgi:ribose 5-phosphate isomerase B|nr:ribose 5-phosphate isomerase B [Alphaproteobacteria bacterium]PPR13234.1 MAG: putative sugar phosphate isomerase YwlF [Alphaproteobacteria bacterium MarineAlpha12_Bin1]|tara:strand:- start:18372 stop:18809 length:438 start_codon:yes stop_codon:yes gene_type:complete
MNNITVAIAADHAGYGLKEELKKYVSDLGYDILDCGTNSQESVDYPDFGKAVADSIIGGRAERGVLVCGTGIGISISANRYQGIRAAVCHDVTTARYAREHNDANVIALGARIIGTSVAKDCLNVFLSTPFENNERHLKRIMKLD